MITQGTDQTSSMPSIRNLLERDTGRLTRTLGLSRAEARLELRVLLGHALNVDRAWLIGHEDRDVNHEALQAYEHLLARRLEGIPIAYLLGWREFYGRMFKVGPDVLIPRPETELLVDLAKARLPETGKRDVLDLGTGSGCIAITLALERPNCAVTGVDKSQASLNLARENAAILGAKVEWRQANWFSGLAGRRFDLIVANPPYIQEDDKHLESGDVRFEPRHALASGPQGLNDLAFIIQRAPARLKPAGWLLLEHGWNQGPAVLAFMKTHGFHEVEIIRDFAGHDRVCIGSVGKIDTIARI